jgi:hypothetical protein
VLNDIKEQQSPVNEPIQILGSVVGSIPQTFLYKGNHLLITMANICIAHVWKMLCSAEYNKDLI